MSKHAVGPYQLKVQALLIVYKLAHCARPEPYDRTWCLRFLLAFLYSQSTGEDRTHFDMFWKVATKPHKWSGEDRDPGSIRRSLMQREANGICVAVGEQPKAIHDRFWDEITREAHAKRGKDVAIKK